MEKKLKKKQQWISPPMEHGTAITEPRDSSLDIIVSNQELLIRKIPYQWYAQIITTNTETQPNSSTTIQESSHSTVTFTKNNITTQGTISSNTTVYGRSHSIEIPSNTTT